MVHSYKLLNKIIANIKGFTVSNYFCYPDIVSTRLKNNHWFKLSPLFCDRVENLEKNMGQCQTKDLRFNINGRMTSKCGTLCPPPL